VAAHPVVSKVADREHRAADDGGDLLAMFSKQIVTEVGDRDQRKKPEPSNARTIRYSWRQQPKNRAMRLTGSTNVTRYP
jgi:hypothetical protein